MYNHTNRDYVHNMSALNNNSKAQSFIREVHRRDVTVKVRKQSPATESMWSLITAPDAASPVCILYSVKQMSLRQ